MWEQGFATFVDGTGRISTSKPPTTVHYTPSNFDDPETGNVLFTRYSQTPPWNAYASKVVEAPAVARLIDAARPAAGWTPAAGKLLQERAFYSVADQKTASNIEIDDSFETFDLDRFTKLGQSTKKLTVAAVREALG